MFTLTMLILVVLIFLVFCDLGFFLCVCVSLLLTFFFFFFNCSLPQSLCREETGYKEIKNISNEFLILTNSSLL